MNTSIRALRDAQRAAFLREGPVSLDTRRRRLQRVIDVLVAYCDRLCETMREDFGGRPILFSLMNDVLGSLASLKASRDHLHEWLADEPRESVAPFSQFGASAWVTFQPKGTIGIIGTWNAPLFTLFAPLASVFAAGNRAVLKPSEIAPRTADLVALAVAEGFSPEELAVVTGGPEIAAQFTAQPWDHLVFTGATSVGRLVMRAAAANLVPVTLELGGKSPVLVGPSADIRTVAERIAVGKGANSGQLCVSPDTVWVHETGREDLVAALRDAYLGLYPGELDGRDLVPIVNVHHFERIQGYLADARARGARIETIGRRTGDTRSADSSLADRRMPLHLVLDAPPDSLIATREIFGPALLIQTYRSITDAVTAINAGERPLALYYFGNDEAEQRWVLEHTLSGGVAINDVLMHAALEDAPFGGVGASGMGHYHGREGFLEFSHARSVYKAGTHDPRREWGMLPPYNQPFAEVMRAAVTP